MSLCIMRYTTRDPYSQKELSTLQLGEILKFGVNQANVKQDTVIIKLENNKI